MFNLKKRNITKKFNIKIFNEVYIVWKYLKETDEKLIQVFIFS